MANSEDPGGTAHYVSSESTLFEQVSIWSAGLKGLYYNVKLLCRGRQHSFVEIDHEILSTVILSHPLIQEGKLSVSG